MKECGVCPASTCVDRSVLGLPPSSSNTSSASSSTPTNDASSAEEENEQPTDSKGNNNKGALIGGIVGGLLGGLVIFTAVGCLLIRRYKHKSKNLLPFASSNLGVGYSSTSEKTSNVGNTRQVTSGVIPVTYIPPGSSNNNNTTTTTARDSNRASQFLNVTDYDSDGESADTRSSMASTADNPTTPSKTGYAIAVSRARPQIMRVNQIQIPSADGLSRSSSVRTVLTREANLSRSNTAPARRVHKPPTPQPRPITMLNPAEQQQQSLAPPAPDNNNDHEDPFHDRHSISVEDLSRPSSSSLQHQSTLDTRTLGDGEITIYWNPDEHQQKR
ncbi:hypothetical protein O0I10_008521 [Lichtheimia ornata]|uniref:Membrane anchor Opy2 N-terminal domain-containing protein n=1 Tax=Lichtheimia ornata TaxID=688661 RepID=A0AAD7UYL9_9FUNG|nr:uncharacterized protein O0I10_008521 [Lichtheimia ornata]KAJ8655857.1 hypothetical protein O0I10_008521 [Lichtheimia ornata]